MSEKNNQLPVIDDISELTQDANRELSNNKEDKEDD